MGDGFVKTFMALLSMEMFGPHQDRLGSGMRFCADMMYSGHTYFTCLYGLGLVELVRRVRAKFHRGMTPPLCDGCVIFISLVCVIQQAVEIYLVELDHFHYTAG